MPNQQIRQPQDRVEGQRLELDRATVARERRREVALGLVHPGAQVMKLGDPVLRLDRLVEDRLGELGAADVELLVGPVAKKFSVHSFVLLARSAYFRSMLTSGLKETDAKRLELPSVVPEAFEMLLPFM